MEKDFIEMSEMLDKVLGGKYSVPLSSLDDSVIEVEKQCTTFCTESCSNGVGSTSGTTKGIKY